MSGQQRNVDTHNQFGGTAHGSVVQAGSVGQVTIRQAAPMAAVVPGTPVPRLLPAHPAHFTDREPVLAELSALLERTGDDEPRLAVLVGAGGIGKTATALRWAWRLPDRFPDGQLYADLRGATAATAVDPSEILTRFLLALGIHPDFVPRQQEEKADLYRSLLAERRVLVLLDNAHSAAQVRPLLAGAGSVTIVTSRHRLTRLVSEPDLERQVARLSAWSAKAGHRVVRVRPRSAPG